MRIKDIILENTESDDDLFGPSISRLLSPQQSSALVQAMTSIRTMFERDPESKEMHDEDPDEWNAIYRDFSRAIVALRQNDLISAMAALQNAPQGYDYDEWAIDLLDSKTGINLWKIMDMDDPKIEAAFDKARLDMQAAHTRFDDLVQEEESDEELFGTSGPAAQRIIYNYGKQMLQQLARAWELGYKEDYDEIARDEDGELMPNPDTNAMFNLITDITDTEFGKAFVVDSIIREYTSQEGLNDFGWMLESGEFSTLTDAWEEFGRDHLVGNEDWFKVEMQSFMGDR